MKKILTVLLTLLIVSGTSYAQQVTMRDIQMLVSPETKSVAIAGLTNAWPESKTLVVMSPCIAEQIPVWWRIQSHLPNGCLIVNLGHARIGQQETILYGQPLPAGWMKLDDDWRQENQLIEYVGK
jgi:hypothetical protein